MQRGEGLFGVEFEGGGGARGGGGGEGGEQGGEAGRAELREGGGGEGREARLEGGQWEAAVGCRHVGVVVVIVHHSERSAHTLWPLRPLPLSRPVRPVCCRLLFLSLGTRLQVSFQCLE